MPVTYMFYDGMELSTSEPSDVIIELSDHKLTEPASIAGYRRDLARRALAMTGAVLDPTSDHTIVNDMIATGLLIPVDTPDDISELMQ